MLFGIWPFSVFAYTCVFCFGFDFDATRTFVVAVTLVFAAMNGSLYGLVGFTLGYVVSKAKHRASF